MMIIIHVKCQKCLLSAKKENQNFNLFSVSTYMVKKTIGTKIAKPPLCKYIHELFKSENKNTPYILDIKCQY